jgi:hypothetical protein
MNKIIALVLWSWVIAGAMIGGIIGGLVWAFGHECQPDPTVWRCTEYVPGTADCQTLERTR